MIILFTYLFVVLSFVAGYVSIRQEGTTLTLILTTILLFGMFFGFLAYALTVVSAISAVFATSFVCLGSFIPGIIISNKLKTK